LNKNRQNTKPEGRQRWYRCLLVAVLSLVGGVFSPNAFAESKYEHFFYVSRQEVWGPVWYSPSGEWQGDAINLGGLVNSMAGVSPILNGDDAWEIFAIGVDGAVWTKRHIPWDAGNWMDWMSLGGISSNGHVDAMSGLYTPDDVYVIFSDQISDSVLNQATKYRRDTWSEWDDWIQKK